MARPRVSVLTPVYNGEEYLAECIESVLAQSYSDFEYDIVNNCSTDRTLEIARGYAEKDKRIRVRSNAEFVGAIDNHNIAFGLVPGHCKYCKVVSADDWIAPDCVEKLVERAESHHTAGIVGCYQRSGSNIRWTGLSPRIELLPGREAARMALLDRLHFFGTPTSVLYRADLVKSRSPFFPHTRSHADTSACYEAFRNYDLGFVHEVLSNERVHTGQWTTRMDAVDAGIVSYIEILQTYGPVFLSETEFKTRKKSVIDSYYRDLGGYVWKLKGREFWKFHQKRMREMGNRLEWGRVARAAIQEAAIEARSPLTAMRKVREVLRSS